MVCVLKLVTNLLKKGNRFGVEVKGLTEGSREKLAEALATVISVNNTLVTMVDLGQFQEVHEVVLPNISEEYKGAMVIEEEEVLTLLPEESGTQTLFVNTGEIPED